MIGTTLAPHAPWPYSWFGVTAKPQAQDANKALMGRVVKYLSTHPKAMVTTMCLAGISGDPSAVRKALNTLEQQGCITWERGVLPEYHGSTRFYSLKENDDLHDQ